jgi:hypothetical protein
MKQSWLFYRVALQNMNISNGQAYLMSESCPAWRVVECNGRDPAEPLAIPAELTGGGILWVSALGTGSWFG